MDRPVVVGYGRQMGRPHVARYSEVDESGVGADCPPPERSRSDDQPTAANSSRQQRGEFSLCEAGRRYWPCDWFVFHRWCVGRGARERGGGRWGGGGGAGVGRSIRWVRGSREYRAIERRYRYSYRHGGSSRLRAGRLL